MMYFSKEELEILIGCLNAAWMEGFIGDDDLQNMEQKLEKQLAGMG